jgi:predicted PurR-regulated permease PerM
MDINHIESTEVRPQSLFERVATFALVAALLFFGAGIFVPLVLATLFAFALAPVVTTLNRRLHIPDALAVIIAVLMVVALLAAVSLLAGTQIVSLAQALPGYRETITTKLEGLQSQFEGFTLLDQLQGVMSTLGQGFGERGGATPAGSPVPVTISNELGPLGLLTSLLGSIIGPIATVAIVAVFLIFLLMGRADLQDRFIRLVSRGRYSLTSIAITDASRRVGRYLIIQLMVNVVYGCIFATGLWIIGVPSALLWGLLIILFRYIPFVGALIIAVVPFMLAFAVDPGWSMLLQSVALFLVLDLTTANVIEPRLYGSSTGVSPIAILLSAMFWAALWGPVGLILATPMTVCLVVIGRHLPQLQFLETLLGSEPVLSPTERLYNRLLKGDTEGAIELADEEVEDEGRETFLTDTLLPALRLAERERADDPQTLQQRRRFIESFEALVDDVSPVSNVDDAEIVLIGGKSEIDEGAALLLGIHFKDAGHEVRILPPMAIRQEAIGRLDLDGVKTVVLVFLGQDIRAQSRYAARRIRRMYPDVRIVALMLDRDGSEERAETLHVDALYGSAPETVDGVISYVREAKGVEIKKAAHPLAGLGRGDDAVGKALDDIAARFDMPVATINLLDDDRHKEDAEAYRITRHIAETRKPTVIRSDEPHAQLGENAYIQTNSIDLYVGVPLIDGDGASIGALVLMNYEPAEFTDAQVAELEKTAAELMQQFVGNAPPETAPGKA